MISIWTMQNHSSFWWSKRTFKLLFYCLMLVLRILFQHPEKMQYPCHNKKVATESVLILRTVALYEHFLKFIWWVNKLATPGFRNSKRNWHPWQNVTVVRDYSVTFASGAAMTSSAAHGTLFIQTAINGPSINLQSEAWNSTEGPG